MAEPVASPIPVASIENATARENTVAPTPEREQSEVPEATRTATAESNGLYGLNGSVTPTPPASIPRWGGLAPGLENVQREESRPLAEAASIPQWGEQAPVAGDIQDESPRLLEEAERRLASAEQNPATTPAAPTSIPQWAEQAAGLENAEDEGPRLLEEPERRLANAQPLTEQIIQDALASGNIPQSHSAGNAQTVDGSDTASNTDTFESSEAGGGGGQLADFMGAQRSESGSEFGEDFVETYSITSSILDYEYENGRRYPSDRAGDYMMPNDEEEQERLDLTHHLYLMMMRGELHDAPIKNPQKILDLGTGTGIWAIDIADKFPGAQVTGNDLSPIQPRWTPPNVDFLVDDYENEWIERDNTYDFIHSRNLSGCVGDWPRLLQQAYDHLKPGGYLELQESAFWGWSDDGSLKDDSPFRMWLDAVVDAGRKMGRELNIYKDLKTWLIDHGFEDVHEKEYFLPFSPWPEDPYEKEIGKYQYVHIQQAVEAYGLRLLTQILGWNPDRTKILQALVKQQFRDPTQHIYTKIVVAYGRKPNRTF